MSHEKVNGSDEWYTPKYVFDALGCSFDMDVASPVDRSYCNVPASEYITSDSLNKQWKGFVWMNPPFSGKEKSKWLSKISSHNGGGIALTPDRTSADWWQEAARTCDAILFLTKRVKFYRPDGTIGDQPANGTNLFAYGSKAVEALKRAQENGLGIILIRNL